MLRVLQINAGENFGGVSAMVYNIYRFIDHSKVQFDFTAPNVTSYYPYRSEITEAGGRIYELHADGFCLLRKLKFWNRLSKHIHKQGYRVIHINSGSVSFNLQVALIARACKVEKIIIHSHNAGNSNERVKLLTPLFRKMLSCAGTDHLSCSHKAAEYMFSSDIVKRKAYRVILNGVETQRFSFDQGARNRIRAELGLEDRNVLLHVGRFNVQKNHSRLIEIFRTYLKTDPSAVLLLAGEGELFDGVKAQASKTDIEKNVIFLGLRKDVPDLFCAADLLVLPSLYEGLPVVGIEAQCSGLRCVFSSEITREIDLSGQNAFVSLDDSDEIWVQHISELLKEENDRYVGRKRIEDCGYSIESTAKIVEELYLA